MATIFGGLTDYTNIDLALAIPSVTLMCVNLICSSLIYNFSDGSICELKQKFKYQHIDLLGGDGKPKLVLYLFYSIGLFYMITPVITLAYFAMCTDLQEFGAKAIETFFLASSVLILLLVLIVIK